MSDVTVVITNFQRPDFLWKCFQSVAVAGVQNIVVTSSGSTKEVKTVHDRIRRARPNVVIVSEDGDSGCNKNWIRGVESAKTKWVTILHDDDLLLSGFSKLESHFDLKAGFYLWVPERHGMGQKGAYPALALPTGIYPSRKLFRNVMIQNYFTLSPTIGCFQRDQLLGTLQEAQENFGQEFHLRPTMMIGNDLLIWLQAIQKNRYFKWIKAPMTSYGHHKDSTTCREVFENRGELSKFYNRTRSYFLESHPRILHVVPRYHPFDTESQRRIAFAEQSWNTLYRSGTVLPLHIWSYQRDSRSIGDNRATPFLKDLIGAGLSCARKDDIVMFTNDDTVLHHDLPWFLFDFMLDEDAVCAFRQSYPSGKPPAELQALHDFPNQEEGTHDWGRDLFAFKRSWLLEHLHEIPDYVTGATDWDSTLATMIRVSKGIPVSQETWVKRDPRCELPNGFVWHETHMAKWAEARLHMAGNRHNRSLSLEWIRKNKVGWVI